MTTEFEKTESDTSKDKFEGTQEGSASLNSRRRLLAASAAAPLIASLHPSTAMAMSSSSCVKPLSVSNQKDPTKAPNNPERLNDAYREEVDFFKGKGNTLKVTLPPNSDCRAPTQNYPNRLYYLDDGQNPAGFYSQDGTLFTDITEEDLICWGYEKGSRFVVGVFNAEQIDGDPILYRGLWPAVQEYDEDFVSLNATPIAQSCLTSLAIEGEVQLRT